MFAATAGLVIRRGWLVLLAWAALAVVLQAVAPPWERVSQDDNIRFFPSGYASVRGQDLLERGFPGDYAGSEFVVIAERPDGRLNDPDRAYVRKVSARLRELMRTEPALGIKQVHDYNTPIIGARLIGNDPDGKGQVYLTTATLSGTYISKQARLTVGRLEDELAALPPPPAGLAVLRHNGKPILPVTGSAVVGHDTNQALNDSIHATTWATVGLVIAILLLVYRSPLLALIPLLTIALSVYISLKGIATMTLIPNIRFQVINVTSVFVVVVLFGAGTDYCLFLIARYREELARGRSADEALEEALRRVGAALLASAGTVILGLGMLYFSSFAKIQYSGPAIALSLAVALVAALTLAPVLLHWLRGAVFWPFKPPHHTKGADPEVEGQAEMPMHGFWTKVADLVVRRPGLIFTASLLALAPFAVVGLGARPNYGQLSDLSPTQPSIVGTRIISRYFPVGELGKTTVLVAHPDLDFLTHRGRDAVEALSRRLAAVPDVAEVRSVSRPLGRPAKSPVGQFGQRAFRDLIINAQVNARYVSTKAEDGDHNHITRLDVAFKTDPYSEESLDTLAAVDAVVIEAAGPGGPLAGASATGLAGPTVLIGDLKKVTTIDERRMYVLVTIGVYAILVVLLRRPGICLYLIATVVLGYLASLGITELTFRALHRGPEPWFGLDWKVGFFLFVILVAVGEDYNILLMARVVEEEARLGPVEGTRRAVLHTGGIISSCGLIMACTFGSMLMGSLTSLRELGFALGLGVLLDTFVVRPVLVPAFVILLSRLRGRDRFAPTPAPLSEATTTSP